MKANDNLWKGFPDELKDMMNAETWLTAAECLEYGFATEIADEEDDETDPQQTAFGSIRNAILNREPDRLNALEKKVDIILNALQDGSEPAEPAAEPEPTAEPEPEPEQKQNKIAAIFSLFAQ